MKTVLIFTLLFLSGCTWFAKKPVPTTTDMTKLTAPQKTVVYVDRVLSQTNWVITICLLGCGLGFFAFLSGNGMGLKIMASCAFVICGALILASAAAWIAVATKWIIILAVVAAAVALAALAYAIFVKGKALKEIVAGVENLKTVVIPSTLQDKAKMVLSQQSPSTRAVVASIKESLPTGT